MILYGNAAPDAELVILYGNCQTVPLAMLLAAADASPKGRGYVCVLNHAVPGQPHVMPGAEELQRCILYLEQYDSEESIATRETLRQGLPDSCPRLIFPTFMMFCFWPFDTKDPRAELEPNMPWGRYPYGDSVGLAVAAQGLSGDQAVSAYLQLAAEHMPDLQQRLLVDIERITRHDQASDIAIGDYVLDNFRRQHLFWTTGHVCSEALGVLGKRIYQATLPLLGGDPNQGLASIDEAVNEYSGMGNVQVPIHPDVARELELEFYDEQMPFLWFGHRWDFNQYITRYIAYDRSWQIEFGIPSPPCNIPPVDIYRADLQLSTARHLRWMPDRITLDAEELIIEGWALNTWDAPQAARFLINGRDIEQVEWPIASPDLLAIFGAIPNTDAARFRCRQSLSDDQNLFQDDFVRLNVTGQFGEHRHSYRTAWYLCDPRLEARPAQTEQIDSPRLGGATITMRIQQLLVDRFDRGLNSFTAVLDLHCGYLTHYLSLLCPHKLTGVASDAEKLHNCAQSTPNAHFQLIDWQQPMPFAAASFDLAIGISLLGQLGAPEERAWLTELQRLLSPGGLVLLSLPGQAQAVLHQIPSERLRDMQQEGILQQGATGHVHEVLRSHDYVQAKWEEFFDVLEIVPAIAGSQDLVVMRRR